MGKTLQEMNQEFTDESMRAIVEAYVEQKRAIHDEFTKAYGSGVFDFSWWIDGREQVKDDKLKALDEEFQQAIQAFRQRQLARNRATWY